MTDLFGNLIRVTLSMSVLIAFVLFCTPFLKKRYSAGWRYWVWMVIAIRLLIPFQMPAIALPDLSGRFQTTVSADWPEKQVAESHPAAETELLSQQETDVRKEQTVQIQQQQKEPLPVVPAEQKTQTAPWAGWTEKLAAFPWAKAGMAVWMLGAAVMLTVHLATGNRMRRVLRTCTRPVQNPDCQAVWKEIKDKTGYLGPMRLAHCPAVSSPMVVGLRRPQLLLPREDYPAEALEMIFRHELVHVMRHDLWYKLLLIAASTIHWFNPLVHWMVKAADRDLEISCDEKVTRRRNRDFRAKYGEAIFEVLQRDSGKKFFFTTNFCNEKKI
ncbi:MAG: M56 family metallopeptidase [Oscillospiraceae bacterium]